MKYAKKINYIAKIAILSALAFVLMLFEMPLAFIAPPFYEMDFSDVIALIGGFALGPVAGVLIELLKNLLNILFTGSSTAYVGELANFVTGCALVLITHSLQQAKRVADEVLFFYKGDLWETGTKKQVLYAPERAETKRFLEFYGV